MNKLKNVIVLTLCLIATSAFGADTATTSASTSKGILGLFDRQEVSINAALDYQDVTQSKLNPSLGLSYFPTKYVGVRGLTTINIDDVKAFNNGEFVGIVRLPLLVVSPYLGAGAKYSSLRVGEEFSAIALVGLETRIAKGWGAFIEAQHDFAGKNTNVGDFSVKVGLNLRVH